jgi:AAA domain
VTTTRNPHYAQEPDPEEFINGEQESTYKPQGNSPIGYLARGICEADILVGDGFLERSSAALLAGSSGIGKSSIAMQMGCCWSCGKPAFRLDPHCPRRIVMMQNEDSANDLVRQSESLRFLGLDQTVIEKNFWIETVRGKIGLSAINVMRDLIVWHNADILILNPLTAYHDGDISQNKDNIRFLYGQLGALLDELKVGLFAFHHKGKPAKIGQGKAPPPQPDDVYFQVMYDILGGSTLTNFFRGIITVSPLGDGQVFKFIVAKRFEESGWPLKSQMFKWDDDRSKRLWVPASSAEADNAAKKGHKTLDDLYALVPVVGTIPAEILENNAHEAGFVRREYRALLQEALEESTLDELRLYRWEIYNPVGRPGIRYGRTQQPTDEIASNVSRAKKEKS